MSAVVLPLLLLAILEAALRLGGYGYSTSFFRPMQIGGQDFLVENDSFGFRFFPPAIARTPASFRMPVQKPNDAYRIFIFGESAALGDPEPAYGAGRYLEVLLRERYPHAHFEVINTAMTAINSHAILPIARDCARQHGDLWIIYMGNNEMVGPFGAATVFGAQAPPWPVVRLNLALQTTRVGQLLSALGRKFHWKGSANASWGGMQMFLGNQIAPGDPRKQTVYHNFQRNLQDILSAGLNSGAHIILSTVAVNLKDCPPFASLINPRLSIDESNRVMQLFAQGNSLADAGRCTGAMADYQQAAHSDPQCALTEFRWASCLKQAGDITNARAHYQNAVDDDGLPFRTDSRINQLIASAATQLTSPRLTLLNSADALESDPLHAIPGDDVFYEHVHLNFDGNYRLALAWANQVARLLPSDLAAGASVNWVSQDLCEQRLGLTDWDRYDVLAEVVRRLHQPPLSGQYDNDQRLQFYSTQLADLQKRMDDADAALAQQTYEAALKAAPNDYYVLEHFANFLSDRGEYAAASEQWEKVRVLIPQDHAAYYELGRLAGLQGHFDTAKTMLTQAVTMHPSFAPGWYELGKARAASGDYEPALQAFNQALKFEPRNAATWFDGGLALAMLGRRAEAINFYRQAVKYAPDDWKAHYELGGLLGQEGKMSEARDESAVAVRLNPQFPISHLNLGMALVQLGQLNAAEQEFEATLRLDPTNSKAADYLDQTKALLQKKP